VRFPVLSGRLVRCTSLILAAVLVLELSPLPVLASARSQSAAVDGLRRDLALLETQGKEAFTDALFERLAADEARAKDAVRLKVRQVGARRVCMLVLAIGSPVLAALVAVIPEPWQEAAVVGILHRFISKALRQVREIVSALPAARIRAALAALADVVSRPGGAASALSAHGDGQGQSWWERFFGNSTMVRNFIVCIVSLAAIGVAVGLAIAGSTAAPIVAVVGALVALIALLNGPPF
jgi:hypothetical protein